MNNAVEQATAAVAAAWARRATRAAELLACRPGDPTLNEKSAAYQGSLYACRAAQAGLDAAQAAPCEPAWDDADFEEMTRDG